MLYFNNTDLAEIYALILGVNYIINLYSVIFYFSFIIILLFVIVSVGFFTLLERKVLGYIQIRKGPCKVGLLGILQPFRDGLKLFIKEQVWPINSNFFIYYVCPIFRLFQSLIFWVLFPVYLNFITFDYGILFFLSCSRLGVYSLIFCGWSSNRVYSILGCIRRACQAISYEVSLSLLIFGLFILVGGYRFINFIFYQSWCWFIFISFPVFFVWLSCIIAETNRTPFDFSEGERELVSGFNVEYGRGGFAFLFIAEYSNIIFISIITCIIFLGCDLLRYFFFIKLIIICIFFIWVRCSLPRYRYDKLIYLAWKCYLPLSLNYYFFFFLVKFLFIYHFFL